MDWHHPIYLPRRVTGGRDPLGGGAPVRPYEAYLHGQVGGLLTRCGDIGVMWFDGQWENTWTQAMGRRLYDKCRALQPAVIVNNRRFNGWSAAGAAEMKSWVTSATPEQEIPPPAGGRGLESCITMNRNWGYNSRDHDFKSVEQLVGMLVETASKGGNLLLNVGPKPDGSFPEEKAWSGSAPWAAGWR
ncbi:MAG: alpha-L-fucosidase [Gemmatimonadetes bacterium]|nr:alpha-L-fucosidase [Gemmatimonadota bacterium]